MPEVPVVVRAMVLTRDVLFAAGPTMTPGETANEPRFDRGNGQLLAFAPADGQELARCELESRPVFDGMIAANGRLYMSLANGTVLCMGADD